MQKHVPIVLSTIKDVDVGQFKGGIREAMESVALRVVLPNGQEWGA